MRPVPRDRLKRLTGGALGALMPAARYDRTVLMLSHMRSASTALANVIASHPEVSGYGETHVPHDAPDAPGRLLLNLALRGGWSPRGRLLFDKVLHNGLDATPPPQFGTARALFLVRAPGPAIASLQRLARSQKLTAWRDAAGAAGHYAARTERLAELWQLFPADRRLGLESEALLASPDAALARVGAALGLCPPLVNRYASHPASRRGGGGDPLRSGTLSHIAAVARGNPVPLPDGLPPALAARCTRGHARLVALFAMSD